MTRKVIVAVCVLGLLATCRKSSTPTSPTTPTPTVAPVLASLTIEGPSSIQPGDTRQFTLRARMSDGTTPDVTSAGVWRTTNPAVINVASGLVTAAAAGEVTISASYQGRSASLAVVSLPDGTGILAGNVRESTFAINNSTVEIVGGPYAGKSVISSGFYRLYGVVGNLQVRASAAGYVAQTTSVSVSPFTTPRRDSTLNFDLTPVIPDLSLPGNYRVTLIPSPSCTTLPADVGTRQYTAAITQNGPALTIVLGGAEFATISGRPSNQFSGRARSNAVELTLGSTYYYYYYYTTLGFAERLIRAPVGPWGFNATRYLTVFGTSQGSASPSSFSTTLNGTLAVVDAPTGFTGRQTTLATCKAADHQFVFVRQ
jgi:hypothetical protein